jgi:uncharacterized membrane protein YeaQ/YmgE (transglycosylase-associated protein family)
MDIESHHLITWIVIGLIAGALAGRVVEGGGFGCLGNLVVGIAGAIIGGVILRAVAPDVRYEFLGSIVVAFIGAALLLAVLRFLSGGRRLGGVRGGRRRLW